MSTPRALLDAALSARLSMAGYFAAVETARRAFADPDDPAIQRLIDLGGSAIADLAAQYHAGSLTRDQFLTQAQAALDDRADDADPETASGRRGILASVHTRTIVTGAVLAALVGRARSGDLTQTQYEQRVTDVQTASVGHALGRVRQAIGADVPTADEIATVAQRSIANLAALTDPDLSDAQAEAYARAAGGAAWSAFQADRRDQLAAGANPWLLWSGTKDGRTCDGCGPLLGTRRRASDWDVSPGDLDCGDNDRCNLDEDSNQDDEGDGE